MVHYFLQLTHWISVWYTSLSCWPTGFPYGTLLSSTGTMAIPMVHFCLLMAHWLSLWYTILSYWPTGYLYGTLVYSNGPLAIPLVHYPPLLAHWLSLWYTSIFYWPTGYLNGTLLSSRVRSAHLSPGLPTGLTRVNPGWVLSLILEKVGNTG